MAVALGTITLDGFEVPAGIIFGGRQDLAKHQLAGGRRVVDSLGPDEADIHWYGVLAGAAAADRARLLDGLRRSGETVPLTWGGFQRWVVVAAIHFEYTNPWWIPYSIRCVDVGATNIPDTTAAQSILPQIINDLTLAATYSPAGNCAALVSAPGATIPGTVANAAAGSALKGLVALLNQGLATTSASLPAASLSDAITTVGNLANISAARCFALRALHNYSDLS